MSLIIRHGCVRYTPEFGGNRTTDNPCVVTMRPMTAEQVRRHAIDKASLDEKDTEEVFNAIDETVSAHVVSVKGVNFEEYDDDGMLLTVSDSIPVQRFVELADRELLLELYQAITNQAKLNEGLAKKSSLPPAS